MSNELAYMILGLVVAMGLALVAYIRSLQNRQDKLVAWLTTRLDSKDIESREDRDKFNSTVRQFQEVLIVRIDDWIAEWKEHDKVTATASLHVKAEHKEIVEGLKEVCGAVHRMCDEYGIGNDNSKGGER